MAFVAIKSCTMQDYTHDPSGTASYTIQSGTSTKSKVTGKSVCLEDMEVQVMGLTSPGNQVEPVTVKIKSTQASKSTFDSKKPLVVGDKSSGTETAKFQVGQSTVTQPITIEIVQAGQEKVQVK